VLMKFTSFALVLSIVALFLACSRPASGQGTDLGTIRGTVSDSSGAVIAGAAVIVSDTLTGAQHEAQSNAQGSYQVFGLGAGTYKVEVSANGMTKVEITNIVINGSDVITADAVLKVATATQSLVVTMEAPAINTEDQTISQTLDNQAV